MIAVTLASGNPNYVDGYPERVRSIKSESDLRPGEVLWTEEQVRTKQLELAPQMEALKAAKAQNQELYYTLTFAWRKLRDEEKVAIYDRMKADEFSAKEAHACLIGTIERPSKELRYVKEFLATTLGLSKKRVDKILEP